MSTGLSLISDNKRIHLEQNSTFPINKLPKDLICHIFDYFSTKELGQNLSVCKRWRELIRTYFLWSAIQLKEGKFSKLTVVNHVFWEKCVNEGIKLDSSAHDDPLFDRRLIIPALEQRFARSKIEGVEDSGNQGSGWTIVIIPKSLSDELLAHICRSTIAQTSLLTEQQNSGTRKSLRSKKVIALDTYGYEKSSFWTDPVKKTYAIAITDNILQGSAELGIQDQDSLLKKMGCQKPAVLEMIALLVSRFIQDTKRLYCLNQQPRSTFCADPSKAAKIALTSYGISYDPQFVVGGFTENKITVAKKLYGAKFFANEAFGIGGAVNLNQLG